jgi:hypothetical protein
MAYVENKECPVCGKVTEFINGKCVECVARDERAKKNKWKSMSYDDRLLDLLQRVEKLERGEPKY